MNLLAMLKQLIGVIVISFLATSPSANAAPRVVVPGCAPIHPPTCVQWKKLKGEGWSVQNKCGAAVSLTLDKTSSTPILSPGQVWPVGIKPPQYLVYDSDGWAVFYDSFKGRQFWNEVAFPCKEKLLVAQQSGRGNSNVGQAPSGSATTSSGPTSKKSSLDIGAKCGKSVSYSATNEEKYPPSTTTISNSWELISEDPIRIRFTLNGKESSQGSVNDYISESERGLRQDQENRLCQEIRFCREDKPGLEKTLQWLKCVAESGTAASNSKSASTKGKKGDSQASRQIPDCPPTLPASCVTWSLYDRQLNWWTVKNGCSKDAKVMFKGDSGTPEDTPVFGPGESTRVTWRGSLEPAYLVWDAQASMRFYREKPAGSALQCRRNLPF